MRKVLIGMVGLFASHAVAQLPTVSLDSFIDWKQPQTLTWEKIKRLCAAQPGVKKSEMLHFNEPAPGVRRAEIPAKPGTFVMKIGAHQSIVRTMSVMLNSDVFSSLDLLLDSGLTDPVDFASLLVQDMTSLEGGAPPVFMRGQVEIPMGMVRRV